MSRLQASLRARLRQTPLIARLVVSMVLIGALIIGLLFVYFSRADRREIEALQTQMLVNVAADLARSLETWSADELSRVTNLATARAVQEFAAARPAQRSALFTPTLDDFTNFLASDPFYRAALLLDARGEVLVSTAGSYVGLNLGDSAFFAAAQAGRAYMSEPGISALDQQPVIWLAAPVYVDDEAEPTGVVALALAPEKLWQRVESVAIGQDGYAIVVDRWGIRLAHGRDRRMIFRSLVEIPADVWAELQTSGRFGPVTELASTQSTALWAYVRDGVDAPIMTADAPSRVDRVYHSAAPIAARDWTVVAMLPEREVLAPANRVSSRAVLATLLLTGLLGVTVVWVAQRLMRPLPQLGAAARQIAGGDLSTPVAVDAGGELGALAATFEGMRSQLEESRNELAQWARELEARVGQRTQELSALSEVVALAGRTQSRDELLSTALAQALQVMQADMGGIWIATPGPQGEPDHLELVAGRGFATGMQYSLNHFTRGEGLLGQVQVSGIPLVLDDISRAPRLARAIVREQELHAFAAVPLRIRGRNLGVLGVFSRRQQPFSAEVVALAESIGQQIALTLDGMNLVEQVRTQARDMASLQERERIAADIHDSMAQMVGYLYLQADYLAGELVHLRPDEIQSRVQRQLAVLEQLSHAVREFISQLQAAPPQTVTLEQTLARALHELAGELTLDVRLDLDGAAEVSLAPEQSTELARIVGEALRNAQQHGQAAAATVTAQLTPDVVRVTIADDGAGFDPDAPPQDDRKHFGLRVMAARAGRLGGTLAIESAPGRGAQVRVEWPPAA